MEASYELLFNLLKDKGFGSPCAHEFACKLVEIFSRNKMNNHEKLKEIEDVLAVLTAYLKAFELTVPIEGA